MKRITCVSFILAIVIFFATSCTSSTTPPSQKANLCDLKDYTLDDTIFELSKEELESVMAAKFSAIDIEVSPDGLKDQDVKVFNCNSVTEYKTIIIKEIVSHRLVEEYYNYLLENSYVECNKSTEQFVSEILNNCERIAKQKEISLDEFLLSSFQMNKQDFNDFISSVWVDMQIVFAYCDSCKIEPPTEVEFQNAKSQLVASQDIEFLLANDSITNDFIKYSVLSEKLYTYIESVFSDQIGRYSSMLVSELT